MELANETSGSDSLSTRNMARGGQTSGGASARQVINDLNSSVGAFSAVACALETGLLDALSESRSLADLSHQSGISTPLVEGILDVLVLLRLLQRGGGVANAPPRLPPPLPPPSHSSLPPPPPTP